MPATEAQTSGFEPTKKQKKKNCFPLQRDLEVEDLSNPVESAKVRRDKQNKGKQPDFTFGGDFVVSCEKRKDGLCCVAGHSLLAEKHDLPSTSNQYELEKNSLRSSIPSEEVDRYRSKKRKTDAASLHNNLAAVKERIRTTEVDSKVHVVSFEDKSSLALQIDGNIEPVVQKVEINEEITPSNKKRKGKKRQKELKNYANEEQLEETVSCGQNHICSPSPSEKKRKRKNRQNELKNYANEEQLEEIILHGQNHIYSNSPSEKERKRKKRQNELKNYANDEQLEEIVLCGQNHIYTNSPSEKKRKRKKRQKELKFFANEDQLEETVLCGQNHIYRNSPSKKKRKSKKRQNEIKNYANEEPPEETVACKPNHIDSNSISTDTKAKSHRPLKGMDTDAIIVKSKSDVVKNSTVSREDVRNGSVVEISAVNSVDKPLLDGAMRHSRRKKAVKQINCKDQVLNHNLEDRGDNNLVQENMDKSSKAHKIVRKCDSSVAENMDSLTVCEEGQPSLTGECVRDGSLSLDLVQVSISLNKAPTGHTRRKLLILDLNGLLADIVGFQPDKKPDLKVACKSLFKRPFCHDFLKFCFERFNVGVWSSRTENNTRTVVNFLMENFKDKLLFCWGQSKCTVTGFNTIENRHKPLLLKELRKLWDKEEPDLPWEKGDYTPANTLLLDDSPYKALRNPPFTAIFPRPYNFQDENDDTLGPGGDLRVYLEGIALADDIPHYVEQHPFGQHAITDTNPSWSYYLRVIGNKNSLLPS